LSSLVSERAIGALEVCDGRRRRSFYFHNGALVRTSSNLKKETAEKVAAKMPGAMPGAVYQRQAALRMAATLRKEPSLVRWHEGKEPSRRIKLDFWTVLWEALELVMSREKVLELLNTQFTGNPVSTPQEGASAGRFRFPFDFREWLQTLDGYRATEEVLAFGPGDPEECARVLYLACLMGRVSFQQVETDFRVSVPEEDEEEIFEEDSEEITAPVDDAEEDSAADVSRLIAEGIIPRVVGEFLGDAKPEADEEEEAENTFYVSRPGAEDVAMTIEEEETGSDLEAGGTGKADWNLDPAEAALRAEIHRINGAENVFEVLNVPWDSPEETFRNAYFNLARSLHPDRLPSPSQELADLASDAFDKAREAWEMLKDEESRQATIDRVIHGKLTEEEEAWEEVKEILEAEKQFDRGLAAFRNGQIVNAHSIFQEAVAKVSDRPEFRVYLGYCTWRLNHGRDEEMAESGIAMLQGAMNEGMKSEEGWILMGRMLKVRDQLAEAKKCYLRALKKNPENREALRELERMTGGKKKKKAPKDEGPAGGGGFLRRIFSRKKAPGKGKKEA